MQAVTSSDFKADEIEIGYSNMENPKFRKLKESEIEALLNELADRNWLKESVNYLLLTKKFLKSINLKFIYLSTLSLFEIFNNLKS